MCFPMKSVGFTPDNMQNAGVEQGPGKNKYPVLIIRITVSTSVLR